MSRITILLFILFLLFLVVATSVVLEDVYRVGLPTLAQYSLAQVGSVVGVTISIPPNPFNTLVQQLKEKEGKLSAQEEELQQKEIALQEQKRRREDKIIRYFFLVGGVLLTLVLLNFYFDYRRQRK